MSTWNVIKRMPVSDNRWAQIEVRNKSLYGFNVMQARLAGTDTWYNLSVESSGDIQLNIKDDVLIHPEITYRAGNSEYITLKREGDGAEVIRISIKGRIAKINLFGNTVELY